MANRQAKVIRKLARKPVDTVLIVGDTPDHDLEPAVRAGEADARELTGPKANLADRVVLERGGFEDSNDFAVYIDKATPEAKAAGYRDRDAVVDVPKHLDEAELRDTAAHELAHGAGLGHTKGERWFPKLMDADAAGTPAWQRRRDLVKMMRRWGVENPEEEYSRVSVQNAKVGHTPKSRKNPRGPKRP